MCVSLVSYIIRLSGNRFNLVRLGKYSCRCIDIMRLSHLSPHFHYYIIRTAEQVPILQADVYTILLFVFVYAEMEEVACLSSLMCVPYSLSLACLHSRENIHRLLLCVAIRTFVWSDWKFPWTKMIVCYRNHFVVRLSLTRVRQCDRKFSSNRTRGYLILWYHWAQSGSTHTSPGKL